MSERKLLAYGTLLVPRPASAVLADLVEIGAAVIAHAQAVIAPPRLLADLRAEVSALVRRPCEGERIADDAELMLCQALEHVAASSGVTREKWIAIAQALLDQVRGDGVRALEAEAYPQPSKEHNPCV